MKITMQDLLNIHGVAWYGNCWRLVDDWPGFILYRNNVVHRMYVYRADLLATILIDIKAGTL
jgi:hypothetical protein